MTLITFQDGKPLMKDGKVGTEQDCCCETGGGEGGGGDPVPCDCTSQPSGITLPGNTPVSVTTNCPCLNDANLSASGTLNAIAASDCDNVGSEMYMTIGYCGDLLFINMGAVWQSTEDVANPAPPPDTLAGRSYGSFVGCRPDTLTEDGGAYSGVINLTMETLTLGVAGSCNVTITLG